MVGQTDKAALTCTHFCCCLVTKSCPVLLRPHGPTRLFFFPGKKTGVCCHFLLQGIFPIQGSNLHLLHWQVDSLPPRHQGNLLMIFTYFINKLEKSSVKSLLSFNPSPTFLTIFLCNFTESLNGYFIHTLIFTITLNFIVFLVQQNSFNIFIVFIKH